VDAKHVAFIAGLSTLCAGADALEIQATTAALPSDARGVRKTGIHRLQFG
jgi:hypothetical protein